MQQNLYTNMISPAATPYGSAPQAQMVNNSTDKEFSYSIKNVCKGLCGGARKETHVGNEDDTWTIHTKMCVGSALSNTIECTSCTALCCGGIGLLVQNAKVQKVTGSFKVLVNNTCFCFPKESKAAAIASIIPVVVYAAAWLGMTGYAYYMKNLSSMYSTESTKATRVLSGFYYTNIAFAVVMVLLLVKAAFKPELLRKEVSQVAVDVTPVEAENVTVKEETVMDTLTTLTGGNAEENKPAEENAKLDNTEESSNGPVIGVLAVVALIAVVFFVKKGKKKTEEEY